MTTIINIQSEAKVIDSVEVDGANFHELTVDANSNAIVQELRDMGGEAIDGPSADIKYIDHDMLGFGPYVTVLVDSQEDADDVRYHLNNSGFAA